MIDNLDLRLIQELQKDGRRSNVELGKVLGVTEGTVRKRLSQLGKEKVLKIVGIPNTKELGYGFLTIMALQVNVAQLKNVARALLDKPAICHLAFVTGRYDLIALVATRTPGEISKFIQDEISVIPGIQRSETFVELETIKGDWLGMDTTQLINSLDPSSFRQKRKN